MPNTDSDTAMAKFPVLRELRGGRVLLRELTEADVTDSYVRWMNDPEIVRYLESRYTAHTAEDILEYVRGIRIDPNMMMWAICSTDTGEHVGNIKLGPVDWNHRTGDIGLMIGERSVWGQGYATAAIDLLSGYAFEDLGLRRLTAGSYEQNTGSIKAFLRAGFQVDGVWRDHYVSEGETQDRICLGLVGETLQAPGSTKESGWKPYRSDVLVGINYSLVPFSEELITEAYIGWLNDPEINRFLEVRYTSQSKESALGYLRSIDRSGSSYFWGVKAHRSGEMVGTATLQSERVGAPAELGLMIGEKDYWGKGAAIEALDLVGRFGFSKLNLPKITAGTYGVNMAMNFTLKRLGMEIEGTIRDAYTLNNGESVDEIRWGVFPGEWKSLQDQNVETDT